MIFISADEAKMPPRYDTDLDVLLVLCNNVVHLLGVP